MSTRGDHEDEEETGPSVDSADPEERIEARRQRIARRLEAQKRFFFYPQLFLNPSSD